MRYPTLSRSRTENLAHRLVAGGPDPNWELEREWAGSGPDVDLSPLREALEAMRAAHDEGEAATAEELEGRFAGDVHRALRDLPIEILDDPGFWRYLSLAEFWWFVRLREGGPIARGNVMTYVDGGRECVPLRMFLRAQAIRKGDDYSLAGALPRATDFWRSHVLRVNTGTAPQLARSLARLQLETRMVSEEIRPLARELNRLWSNIVFHVYEEEDCDEVLRDLYEKRSR